MNIDYLNRVGTTHHNFKTPEMRLNEENQNLKKEIERLNNIINHIEEICKSSIASVDKHLLDNKEIKIKDGKILNYNDYQIIRLKAFRTKSKEILGRIKELKGVDKDGKN